MAAFPHFLPFLCCCSSSFSDCSFVETRQILMVPLNSSQISSFSFFFFLLLFLLLLSDFSLHGIEVRGERTTTNWLRSLWVRSTLFGKLRGKGKMRKHVQDTSFYSSKQKLFSIDTIFFAKPVY